LAFIEIEDLDFFYPESSRPALHGIRLSIDAGEYVAVVGANGSGKSSLLRLLDGLRLPSAGRIRVAGLDTAYPENLKKLRSSVALVFQSPVDQIVSTIVEEDVAFGPENLGLPRDTIVARVEEALVAVGLSEEAKSPPQCLSAGQQQRLAIAGALAMHPSCIAFDEATAMLDPPSRASILGLMDELSSRGVTILHATHDMSEAARATRIIALDSGQVAFDGRPQELFSASRELSPSLRALGLPPSALLSRELGLEPLAGEGAAPLAARIAAARLGMAEPRASLRPSAPVDSSTKASPESGPSQAAFPVFRLEAASYDYLRGTSKARAALRDLSLDIPSGSLVALVGKTGSGKSSLLQLLDALALPSSGKAYAFGQDLGSRATDLRAIRIRAPLAVQSPESAIFEPYAGDDVAFGPRNLGCRGRELVDRVKRAMDRVGLRFEDFRDRRSRDLSGGEKRRLALAGLLAMESQACLFDEPTSALDPEAKAAVLELIAALARDGATVLMATHSMEEAARADLVAVLVQGRLAALGPPESVFYEAYDPAWGIGRPFAAEVAAELASRGWTLDARPLDLKELAGAIREAGEEGQA
jgi:energy-coupling factor transport system ATP-binding protein